MVIVLAHRGTSPTGEQSNQLDFLTINLGQRADAVHIMTKMSQHRTIVPLPPTASVTLRDSLWDLLTVSATFPHNLG